MCAAVSFMVCYREGRGRVMVMCAAVSVMVCYRVGRGRELESDFTAINLNKFIKCLAVFFAE